MAQPLARTRVLAMAAALCTATCLPGCADFGKNVGDYLNFRNSFLDPSQVGRFDKAKPFGVSKPVSWPILDQLDVIDEKNDKWTRATDPLPSDLVAQAKEYTVGEGDLLRVTVGELVTPGVEFIREVEVNELGNIVLQQQLQIHVAGLTTAQIEEKIGQVVVEKGYLQPKGNGNPGPQVSATLLQSRSRMFIVTGQVGAPGTYPIIGSDFRLFKALSLARDIPGAGQPGFEYLYIIRPVANPLGGNPGVPASATPPAGTSNPLDAIDSIERNTAPRTPPASVPAGPGSEGPQFVRPLPTAVVMPADGQPLQVAQADLDAALGGMRPATPSPSTTTPAAPSAGGATTATPAPAPSAGPRPGFVFVDDKWVEGSPAARTAADATSAESSALAATMAEPRIIRIPITPLREGDPRYNIVIKPGDIINVPGPDQGEFYMLGHVRAGVYTLGGRKVTLKQAVAASGGMDNLAVPRRCELIRRIGPNQEVWVQVDLQRIFDGEQPDIFLKPNDLVNVGTDAIMPFLAVMRNAYRVSYGWGFVYDKNLSPDSGSNNNNR